MRSLRVFVLLLLVALTASCAPVKKQAAVERIARAARFDEARVGTLSVSTLALSGQPTSPAALGGASAAPAAPPSLRVIVDPSRRRAALLAPPSAAAKIGATTKGGFPALVVFDGSRIYVRSADAGLVGARPWLAADVTKLGAIGKATTQDQNAPRTAGDLVVLSPIDLLDLARGFLTGSLAVASKQPPSYAGRTSLDKEFRERHRDPSDADTIQDLLRAFAAKDDIHPIAVELDDKGALRRLAVSFIGKPEYGVRFATTLDLSLEAASPSLDESVLDIPKAADVVVLDSLGDLRAAVDQWTAAGGAT